jgi:putative redox protein
MSNVALNWAAENSQLFVGRDSFGHTVISGSWPDTDPQWREWKAVKPSDLLLLSLASCSAYDVVMILGRQRQILTGLYIEVEGHQKDRPPFAFTDIHMHYKLKGENLTSEKVDRAIDLSQNKYCSVAATIRGTAEITYSFEILLS